MPKRRLWRFRVRGTHHFPADMLRYDSCWPHSQKDVDSIFLARPIPEPTVDPRLLKAIAEEREEFTSERIVTLRSYSPPTVDRWKSFSWRVISDESYLVDVG